MTCPAEDNLQQQVFGCLRGTLEWLPTHPKAVVTFARKTLVNIDV